MQIWTTHIKTRKHVEISHGCCSYKHHITIENLQQNHKTIQHWFCPGITVYNSNRTQLKGLIQGFANIEAKDDKQKREGLPRRYGAESDLEVSLTLYVSSHSFIEPQPKPREPIQIFSHAKDLVDAVQESCGRIQRASFKQNVHIDRHAWKASPITEKG